MRKNNENFSELLEIVARLRAEDGCPWDRRQTAETLRPYLMEEAYELLEALGDEDHRLVQEELGDLLFMLVFLARIHQEKNLFSMADAIGSISKKMIRRHPHVFGSAETGSRNDLKKRWHQLKNEEKKENGRDSRLFASIPKALPALRKAQRVSERAARAGFEWPDPESALCKLEEEIVELRQALATGNQRDITEELGDMFFVLTTISRLAETSAEEALNKASVKFIHRFYEMERLTATKEGAGLAELDEKARLALWHRAKDTLAKP